MNPASLASLNAQRLANDYAVNGKPIKLAGVEGLGLYTAPVYNKRLRIDGGGFDEVLTSTAVIQKGDWPEYTTQQHFDKKPFSLPHGEGWQAYRIASVADLRTRGEWRLELEALI